MSRYLAIFIEPAPYLLGLIKELQRLGENRLDVFFLYKNGTQQWNVSIDGPNAQTLSGSRLQAMKVISRTIFSGRYAVVHLAGWSEPLILFTFFISRLCGIPVVVESDTQFPPTPLPVWKRALKRVIYPPLFRQAAILLPGGKRQTAYFRHYGVRDERMVTACMTSDVAQIITYCDELGEEGRLCTRGELNFGADDMVFVFVGRLVACKGVDLLLESFASVSCRFGNARLLIVGDGPLKGSVVAAAEENGAIRFVGRLDAAGVARMFHAGDVAVVPSLLDQWGLVVNEAMAAGLPVITTQVVGCTDDLNPDGSTGIIVSAGSADELTAAMEILAQDDAKRLRMGKNAKELISGWTLEREARTILSVWRKLLSDGGDK